MLHRLRIPGGLDLTNVDAWSNPGGALSIIANRLSYFLDLRGPSVTVDTACSSSIVALHLACQSLRMRDSDVAIAAGVNLLLAPAIFRAFDQTGALSPTGACHAFDADADGFVRGEGCGVVVLKRLSDAVRDGDRLLAVVRGSAVNQDGRSNGLLAPNPAAQMAVLRAAYANAGVPPHEVDYVEAHGTGTLLGDPIEARALGTVLGRGRPEQSPLLIGAVKSNLGHLEAAAGIAGLIKAVLAVQRASIPANLHFQTPNPHIPFDQMRLKVVAEQQDWPHTQHPRRAGVSSFGFGGTNAHAVIEQAPASVPVIREADPAVTTLVVSGKTPERIASMAGTLAEWMAGAGADGAAARCGSHAQPPPGTPRSVRHRLRPRSRPGGDAVASAGRGPSRPKESWARMTGRAVPARCSCTRVRVRIGRAWAGNCSPTSRCSPRRSPSWSRSLLSSVGFSLQQVIADGEPVSGDAQVQPVLMGLQLALTELWRSYGVHPDAVIGHSMGEVSAAVVAGALTVADGLRVIATRSRLMSQLAGQGAVGLLKLDAEATAALIADYPRRECGGVHLAARDGDRRARGAGRCGDRRGERAEPFRPAGQHGGRLAYRVDGSDPARIALGAGGFDARDADNPVLFPRSPRAPPRHCWMPSTGWPMCVSRRGSVRPSPQPREEHGTFIEISAHPILTHAVSDTLDSVSHHHSVGTLWRDGDDTVSFHTNLNTIHTSHPPQTRASGRTASGAAHHSVAPHAATGSAPDRRLRSNTLRRLVIRRAPADGPIPPEWYCQLAWPAQALSGEETDGDSSWLVIADSELGAEIGHVLGDDSDVTVLPPSLLADDTDADGTHRRPCRSHPCALRTGAVVGHFDAESGYGLFNAARKLAAAVTEMGVAPRLFLLTRNAQPVGEGDRANPAHAVLWGLGRTLALEHPEIWGGVIDVDESVPAGLAARYVVDEARGGDGEDQVVYRAGTRRVPRLQPGYPFIGSPG